MSGLLPPLLMGVATPGEGGFCWESMCSATDLWAHSRSNEGKGVLTELSSSRLFRVDQSGQQPPSRAICKFPFCWTNHQPFHLCQEKQFM